MAKDKQPQEEHQLHKKEVEKHTLYPGEQDIERLPASDDDYRLPRELPVDEGNDYREGDRERDEENDDLIDEETDISPTELALLEEAERDNSSDETRASDILEDRDEDGDELNEGPEEDSLFDTGEDLDMPNSVMNPDINAEDEDE